MMVMIVMEIHMLSCYIQNKKMFKKYHIGSTCDPAGTLILVLLTSNTQSLYDNVYFKYYLDLILK